MDSYEKYMRAAWSALKVTENWSLRFITQSAIGLIIAGIAELALQTGSMPLTIFAIEFHLRCLTVFWISL